MSRFIKHITVFFLLALIVYPIIIFFSSHLNNSWLSTNGSNQLGAYGHLYTRINEADSTRKVDVLAVGSSLCYRGIDPREFQKHDLKLFNLGSSGQTHIQTTILLKQYLDQFRPHIVIYECSPSLFNDDGVGSGLDVIFNTHLNWNHLNMTIKINNIKLYNALINSSMQRFLGQYENFSEQRQKGDDTYISGGYVEKELSHYKKGSIKETPVKLFEPQDYQLQAFLENVKLIEKSGAELYLIQAPITSTMHRSYPAADSLFNRLGKYDDFNQLIALDDSLHFYDHTHLNQLGVALFNKSLVERLNMPY